MKKSNLFLAIPRAFYSPNLYREVAQSWHGRSFLYLLILVLICWIVTATALTIRTNKGIYNISQEISQIKIPVIHFKHGIASTTGKKAFHIVAPNSKKSIIIIDTKNTIHNFHKIPGYILIQKHAFFIKDPNQHKITQYYYPKQLTGTIGPTQIQNFITKSKKWIIPILFIAILLIGFCISYTYRVIQILIYALIGMLFSWVLRRKLYYEALMNLAIICITPAMIFGTIFTVFNIYIPYLYLAYFLISMVYLVFAIKANPKQVKT